MSITGVAGRVGLRTIRLAVVFALLLLLLIADLLVVAPGRASAAVPATSSRTTSPGSTALGSTSLGSTPFSSTVLGGTARQAPATTIRISPSDFSPTGAVALSGTRQPGSSVTVTLEESADGTSSSDLGSEIICVVKAADTRAWACPLEQLPNGSALTLVATEEPDDERDGRPAPGSAQVDVLRPPVMDGSGSYLTTGLVSGVGEPGAVVTVSVDGKPDARCSAIPVPKNTQWSCNLTSASGTVLVRAQQSHPRIAQGALSAYSNAQTVTVDRDLPAAAVILSPVAGSTITESTLTVTGTGEDDGTIDVYLDDLPVCGTVVVGTEWSCTLDQMAVGEHTITALQRDRAGNFASPSPALTIVRSAPDTVPPSATPSEAVGPAASRAPAATRPAVPTTPTPSTAPSSSASPSPSASASAIAPLVDGLAAPPGAGDGTDSGPHSTDWAAPTEFGTTLPSAKSVSGAWYLAPLLGLLFLALVAVPLRLLVTTLRDRMPHITLLGRNRRGEHRAEPVSSSSALALAVLPVAIAAVLVLLAVGVAGEVRYLRLLVAIALGLAVLNAVGVAVSTALASRGVRLEQRLRVLPLMLVAAVVTALLSRVVDLDPPLVAGVLLGPAFVVGTARGRGIVNLVQVVAVTALGTAGWLLYEVVTPSVASSAATTGFWTAFASETLATICLTGLWSALILVLPLANLPGRVILEWSPRIWAVTALLVASVVALTVGGASTVPALMPWIVSAAAFAALSVSAWAFVRFVEPHSGL